MNFIANPFFKEDKKVFCQKGQGTLEYILLMVVVVVVIMGFLTQFNDAFAKWGTNYFGNYISCLLEYGELPSLGGGTQIEGCDSAFAPFSITDGRNPFGPQIGEGSQDQSKDKKGDNAENGGNGRTTSDTSGGGKNIFGSRSNSGRGNSIASLRGGRFEAAGGGGDENAGDDLFGDKKNGRMTLDGPKETVIRPRQIYYSMADELDKKKKKEEKKAKVAQDSETNNMRPPRLTVRERGLRKTAAVEDSGFNLGVGGFIRFLFITGIIIAIIILLGSQALQISKEWD